MTAFSRSIDPYQHPISTSLERPSDPAIEINSPHWYQKESEFQSDSLTQQKINAWKAYGKPVVVGEQGNQGANWDVGSALRMRLRTWAAFFTEGVLIFWNSSDVQDYFSATAANLYMGPEEQGYLKILRSLMTLVDANAVIVGVTTSDTAIRSYALRSPAMMAVYLVSSVNHTSATTGITLTLSPSAAGTGTWISPADGSVLGTQSLTAGTQTIPIPAFVTDIALKVGGASIVGAQPATLTS